MTLVGPDATSFTLLIDGYEFQEVKADRWDSNWLQMKGEVRFPTGNWTFRDPCLTTFEVADLADWLESVGAGKPNSTRCSFTEPNLAFECRPGPDGVVTARFAHESAPPWLRGEERFHGFTLSFPLILNDLAAAARDAREMLLMFPERGNNDGAA